MGATEGGEDAGGLGHGQRDEEVRFMVQHRDDWAATHDCGGDAEPPGAMLPKEGVAPGGREGVVREEEEANADKINSSSSSESSGGDES